MEIDPEFLLSVKADARIFLGVKTIKRPGNDGIEFVFGDILNDKLRVAQKHSNVWSRSHTTGQFSSCIAN